MQQLGLAGGDKMRIGEILTDQGLVTEEELGTVLGVQDQMEEKARLGELLIGMGYITKRQRMEALAVQWGLNLVDLKTRRMDLLAVERIPKQMAVKYGAIAIEAGRDSLTVAMHDPMNLYALEDIRLVTDMRILLVLAEEEDIHSAIDLCYSELDAQSAVRNVNGRTKRADPFYEDMLSPGDNLGSPVVRLLNSLLTKGYNTNVSDIHMEPYEQEVSVRMRRDGMLLPYITLSTSIHQALTARIKILAQMDIAEKRKPQDGHFHVTLDGISMHIRVSFAPTVYGEKGVLRFLTVNTGIDYGEHFGMNPDQYKRMLGLIQKPSGLIYLTGPTGSGKTTTLYSVLTYLSSGFFNIATIEDPVERNLHGISQMQVNPKIGIDFEQGLRALLRQDPDILMIGETRDLETATIAARAAMTGHLVFSTLHTNDAVSAAIRLLELGLPSYVAADALAGVVAQRLIRKVCPHCAQEYQAGVEEVEELMGDHGNKGLDGRDSVVLKRGKGCHICDNTGYQGRIGAFEILEIDPVLRSMILERQPAGAMKQYAKEQLGMSTLKTEIGRLVLDGITDMGEMRRITMGIERR